MTGLRTFVLVVLATLPPANAATYYAAPAGASSATGSSSNPWDLQTALTKTSIIQAGDTLILQGGTYRGCFLSTLSGTSASRVVVRGAVGQRATIDPPSGCSYGAGLLVQGEYADYRDFEVAGSDVYTTTDGQPGEPNGIWVGNAPDLVHGNRFINLIIHDVRGQGIGFWQGALDSEIYGSLIYYCGANKLDHGIYSQNDTGTKRIANNILFHNASHALHLYGSNTSSIKNYVIEDNTAFNGGLLGPNVAERNYLIGGNANSDGTGGAIATNIVMRNNDGYYPGLVGSAANFGYDAGCSNMALANNYMVGGDVMFVKCTPATMTGNQWYLAGLLGMPAVPAGNTIVLPADPNNPVLPRPAQNNVIIRPNAYDANRIHITVYDWSKAASVSVDLGSRWTAGTSYELHNAQDFYRDVRTGTLSGTTLTIPMTGHTAAKPVSFTTPALSFPEFGAFVVINTGSTTQPPPCDVDRNGAFNIADVQLIVNQALDRAPCTGDIDQDGRCTVTDVQRIANAVLSGICQTP